MNPTLPPAVRRLVLASALLAATLAALLPHSPSVRAAPPDPLVVAQSTAKSAAEAGREAADAAREAARKGSDAARQAAREARRKAQDIDINVDVGDEDKEGRRKGVTIGIGGVDRQYDSFDQFLDRDPALAFMVLGIVFIVFLTPILIIALIVWYKMRKTRMQNEAMLRLAEKGVVPPAEAMQAISANRTEPVLGAAAGNAPLVEQVKSLRKQAAWSDLRKGVLIGGVGLALTVWNILDDRQPGWLSLILLFVGIGYVVLWYFEDRQVTAAANHAANPVPPGDTKH